MWNAARHSLSQIWRPSFCAGPGKSASSAVWKPTIGADFGFNLRSREEGNVSNPFIDKLSARAPLSAEDVKLLEAACGKPHDVPAHHDLVREGDKPGAIFVILAGWACRYKMLPEGTRQITAFLMPGDCCDLHASVLDQMEHTIAMLTPGRVAMISSARMEELILRRPALTRAFWWTQLVDEDTLRAWMVSMGRRNSLQRVAHLMELYVRAHNIGLANGDRFELPLTQVVLGDALGLTAVHVNRVLRKLRVSGVMELAAGSLIISDISKLAYVAGFDDNYLHRRLRRIA
jgi:CRP-like cAMP-binding protein